MILDGHTHVFPEEVCRRREDYFADEPAFRLLYDSPKSKLVGPEEMVAAMAEAGVEAAVVMGFPWRREGLWRRQHEVILEAMRRFPRTLIGFCAVHILEPGAAREVERCLAAGFKGVGELAWYEADLGEDLTYGLAPIAELCAPLPGAAAAAHQRPGGADSIRARPPCRSRPCITPSRPFPRWTGFWPTGAAACPSTA